MQFDEYFVFGSVGMNNDTIFSGGFEFEVDICVVPEIEPRQMDGSVRFSERDHIFE